MCPHPDLRELLAFFVERQEPSITPAARAAVDAAVVKSLAAIGVGVLGGGRVRPVGCIADVLHTPVLVNLLGLACNSGERDKLLRDAGKAPPAISDALGLRIVRWMRNVDAHWPREGLSLALAGLPPTVIRAALNAGVAALVATVPTPSTNAEFQSSVETRARDGTGRRP